MKLKNITIFVKIVAKKFMKNMVQEDFALLNVPEDLVQKIKESR